VTAGAAPLVSPAKSTHAGPSGRVRAAPGPISGTV